MMRGSRQKSTKNADYAQYYDNILTIYVKYLK